MFANEHTNNPHARQYRKAVATIQRHTGADLRISAAQAKRQRKAEKRKADAFKSAVGQMQASERLTGAPL